MRIYKAELHISLTLNRILLNGLLHLKTKGYIVNRIPLQAICRTLKQQFTSGSTLVGNRYVCI